MARKPPNRRPPPPAPVLERAVLSQEQQEAQARLLGERVKQARLELELTQAQVGVAFGRGQTWVREVEAGRSTAQPYMLAALASATGRSIAWFFGEPDRK